MSQKQSLGHKGIIFHFPFDIFHFPFVGPLVSLSCDFVDGSSYYPAKRWSTNDQWKM